jgi:hypothetical protein
VKRERERERERERDRFKHTGIEKQTDRERDGQREIVTDSELAHILSGSCFMKPTRAFLCCPH